MKIRETHYETQYRDSTLQKAHQAGRLCTGEDGAKSFIQLVNLAIGVDGIEFIVKPFIGRWNERHEMVDKTHRTDQRDLSRPV